MIIYSKAGTQSGLKADADEKIVRGIIRKDNAFKDINRQHTIINPGDSWTAKETQEGSILRGDKHQAFDFSCKL